MRSYLTLSVLLSSLFFFYTNIAEAQSTLVSSTLTAAPSPVISQTPEMSASSVSSFFNALATSAPIQPGGGEFLKP